MTDNHVHIGWFRDGYHSPATVWLAVQKAGIDEIVVSSTSTCAEKYKLVVREMRELVRMGGSRIHPVLWLTPRMIRTWGLQYMLHSKVRWQGVKMHWFAHREWRSNRKLLSQAIDVARKLNVPILLHTGEDDCCASIGFEPLCAANPDLSFVLAHGRPIGQTMQVLSHCSNVFVDTAFMLSADVLTLVENGFSQRIIFGTDTPINQLYFKNGKITDSIIQQIASLKAIIPNNDFEVIMHRCPFRKTK